MLFPPDVGVDCDQCMFGHAQAGCREACVQLACRLYVRSGCPGASGQIKINDEVKCDAGDVMVLADVT